VVAIGGSIPSDAAEFATPSVVAPAEVGPGNQLLDSFQYGSGAGNLASVPFYTEFSGTPPVTVRVTAEWQGCTLELVEVRLGLASYSKHRLFLSDSGSQLIDQVEQHSTFGDSEQRLVFEKTP
jgi:hypothetical protein